MSTYIVTANAVLDGVPTYWSGDGGWSVHIADALPFEQKGDAEEARLEACSQEALVCDPFVLKMVETEGRRQPKTAKHRVRAEGGAATLRRLGYGDHHGEAQGETNVSV
jgi:hypothetical protein